MHNENIKQEELEVLKAMATIARYRCKFASNSEVGFQNLTTLLTLLMGIFSNTQFCPDCIKKMDAYVSGKQQN